LEFADLGIGSPEICQWTFYGNASRKVEVILFKFISWKGFWLLNFKI